MATYAIGDIQGCMGTLTRLLERIDFRPHQDHLLIVGDLVNRGPSSLEALRWAYAHRHSLTLVLGNHDLALLAYAAGVRPLRPKDTFGALTDAPDKDVLLTWLARRPFAHLHHDVLLLHAGVLPSWDLNTTLKHADLAHRALTGPNAAQFLGALEHPPSDDLPLPRPLREAVAAARVLTYLRVVQPSGKPEFAYKGTRADLPAHLTPWFQAVPRGTQNTTIICGHWAALGLHTADNVRAIDTGCVWGGPLTAWCLETQTSYSQDYAELTPPLSAGAD
jgi:bis(5'-nucleosyl)-tetraphosphatase (symmetrical)